MQAVEQHKLKVQKQEDAAKAAASFQVAPENSTQSSQACAIDCALARPLYCMGSINGFTPSLQPLAACSG